ncbi:MAG: DUF58 domain-containing protein [Planctomycetaceae bacterium]|nr:DUF58 domain-containing protein [Planctomycetaceae bacterium]
MFTQAGQSTAARLREAGQGLTGLEFKARQVVDGFLAGSHRGPRRGSSAEFAEHRAYAPGDDLRYLDWKVFGKHDRFYLKQLEQETNFTCHLLLDASSSMLYRSEDASLSKLETGCLAAAAIAWLVLRQQDLVGMTAFAQSLQMQLPPSGQPSHLKQIADALEQIMVRSAAASDANGAPTTEPAPTLRPLHEWCEQGWKRAVVVVLSDCLGDLSSNLEALRRLRSCRHDVVLLHVVDPAEQDFPFDEPTRFHDVESGRAQPVDCRQLRAAYCADFESFRRKLETDCRELGADYALLRTDAPVELALAAFLSRRVRQGA